VRTIPLLALILAAACGSSKPAANVPVEPPPNVDTQPSVPATPPGPDPLIAEAKQFVADTNTEMTRLFVAASVAEWANETDITKEHGAAAAEANGAQAVGLTKAIRAARKFDPVLNKLDPSDRRQLTLLKFSGQPAPEDPKAAQELAKVAEEMTAVYGKGVCTDVKGKESCTDVEVWSKKLEAAKKPSDMLAAWQGWHDAVGHAEKPLFEQYVGLANAGAHDIGFDNVATLWKSGYDMPDDQFEADVDRLWGQVKPLYDQLHCYARRQLNKKYGDKVVSKTGPLPAHLFGNMWAQSWGGIYKDLEPFKGVAAIDVTPELVKQKYDAKKMVQMGEAFYTSLGMPPLPDTFWTRSMFEKPAGKNVVCHASSWDVTYSDDLRIKMCININQQDLWTIHHELGHSYYFAHYYKLPILFQAGANDGFHEAIGDTIQLSMTPAYLKEKGLLTKVVDDEKGVLNHQMQVALEKVAFLPFGLMIDKWRWDVFAGKVKPDDYNQHWWDLRLKYQGIVPPVARSASDFDPGAKFHVASNTPYMRYFLAEVLQFQFHRALCRKSGFTGPLNECSIFNNKEAGERYSKMLALGASEPWQDALFALTGEREMDASAILEYFAPLQHWLEEQNQGQSCGW